VSKRLGSPYRSGRWDLEGCESVAACRHSKAGGETTGFRAGTRIKLSHDVRCRTASSAYNRTARHRARLRQSRLMNTGRPSLAPAALAERVAIPALRILERRVLDLNIEVTATIVADQVRADILVAGSLRCVGFLGRRGRRNYFQAGAGICLQTARLPRPTEGVFWSKKAQNTASRCISDTSMTRRKCLLEYGPIVSRVTEYITDSTQNDRSEIRQRPTHKE
jgi:hypothetical protein